RTQSSGNSPVPSQILPLSRAFGEQGKPPALPPGFAARGGRPSPEGIEVMTGFELLLRIKVYRLAADGEKAYNNSIFLYKDNWKDLIRFWQIPTIAPIHKWSHVCWYRLDEREVTELWYFIPQCR
ncbi:MAG TPA: hypothetical protein VKO45_02620, partial [Methanomicrobiales archaeon]|nr:hypothetical protein [Methanomicrobiales archaeon]